jgi:tetratricopeptide (TPR) repeat protein
VYSDFRAHDLDARLADLADAVSIAAAIGDASASFRSNYNRTTASFQAGNRAEFDAHLDACAALADQLDEPYDRWMVTAMLAERCIVSGDLNAGEEHANAALEIGGDSVPEALTTWGGQLLEIRDIQGRLDELVDLITDAAAENPGLPVLRAALARIYCELDRNDDAATLLEADVSDGFAQFPYDSAWIVAMVLASDVCVQLDQRSVLPSLYERLLPFHSQVAAVGPAARGPVSVYLGMLAGARDDYDHAERHFEESLAVSERLGAPYWTARTRYEWAKVLQRRGDALDVPRAAALLANARDAARQYGFAALEQRAASALH